MQRKRRSGTLSVFVNGKLDTAKESESKVAGIMRKITNGNLKRIGSIRRNIARRGARMIANGMRRIPGLNVIVLVNAEQKIQKDSANMNMSIIWRILSRYANGPQNGKWNIRRKFGRIVAMRIPTNAAKECADGERNILKKAASGAARRCANTIWHIPNGTANGLASIK